MGDWALSLLLIFSTLVHEISSIHYKPYPWRSRQGNSNPPISERLPSDYAFPNPFRIAEKSPRSSLAESSPFGSDLPKPVQSCAKKAHAHAHSSPSRIRDLLIRLREGALRTEQRRAPQLVSSIYNQRGFNRVSRSEEEANKAQLSRIFVPFLTELSSQFGQYLRKVLGCNAERRTQSALPRTSVISVNPTDSSLSSSAQSSQSQSSLMQNRPSPPESHSQISPPQHNPVASPRHSPPRFISQHSTPADRHRESVSQHFDIPTIVSPSRPIQRSFQIDLQDSRGPESITRGGEGAGAGAAGAAGDASSSFPPPSRSDSSPPQPFEELPFSSPPVDMSGLPPPAFATSGMSTSSLPDLVQTITDSVPRFGFVDAGSVGRLPHRVTDVSLLPTAYTDDATTDPTTGTEPNEPTTLTITGHDVHTSQPPSGQTTTTFTVPALPAPSRIGADRQGSVLAPPGMHLKVLVEAGGVVRGEWWIAPPPAFTMIDLLRHLAREQGEPIDLNIRDPRCYLLTWMLELKVDSTHMWMITVISFNKEVLFQDRCLPGSNFYILPGYTVVFRFTET